MKKFWVARNGSDYIKSIDTKNGNVVEYTKDIRLALRFSNPKIVASLIRAGYRVIEC